MVSTPRAVGSAALIDEESPARERILAAATRFFRQFGYEGTSITKIAKEAGMTPANIYWHFPSKLDLLREVLHAVYLNSYADLAAAVGDGTAEERLADYVQAYAAMQLTSPDARSNFGYASLASSLSLEDQRELIQTGKPYVNLLREILQQGVDEGSFVIENLAVTSFAISNMCEYVFTWFRDHGRLDAEQVGAYYAELALRMTTER
ncbi:hypothetical protein BHE97_04790 [Aeromicrobium sp. PE09-221]|uniref:TetR/AcrR family transcriptional regulator n=1 Tax=Aeromicrobium sp. PE09-221 TaxID=1898043 RepID=UPI000B3E9D45|nr:TetR/AcrR family transcriptional regulator [Aeromicrobium sp. PE09-221]OUZ11173.1 hypothetical protein BHE97_04790 [Aeromicrobium sp. PE09-221]